MTNDCIWKNLPRAGRHGEIFSEILQIFTKNAEKMLKIGKNGPENAKNHPEIAIKRKFAKNPTADFSDGFQRRIGLKNKKMRNQTRLYKVSRMINQLILLVVLRFLEIANAKPNETL